MTRRRVKAPEGLRPGQVTGERLKGLRFDKLHAHGCTVCSARYVDACDTSQVNDRCQACRGTPHGRPLWERDTDPIACCRSRCRPATDRVRERYTLGGQGRWWICAGCSRTHPYNPSTGTGDPS